MRQGSKLVGYIQRQWFSKVNEVSNPSVRVVTIEEQSGLGSISPMVSLETNPYPHNAMMTFCRESKCKSRAELAKLAWAIMPRCSFAYSKKKSRVLGINHQLQSVILVSFFSL